MNQTAATSGRLRQRRSALQAPYRLTVPADPREASCDDPSPRQNGEAGDVVALGDAARIGRGGMSPMESKASNTRKAPAAKCFLESRREALTSPRASQTSAHKRPRRDSKHRARREAPARSRRSSGFAARRSRAL